MFPYVGEVTAQVSEALAAYAASELFDDSQRTTLTALCDTWVPSLEAPGGEDPTGFWARSASDYSVPMAVELALLQSGAPAEQLAGLGGLLDALAAEGMAAAVPQEGREAIVDAFMADPEAAAGLDGLRGACLSLHYALPDAGTGINPNWPGIGYPGPQALPKPSAEVERPIKPIVPDAADLTLSADAVVVGSGAGGGVIAAELAAAGKQVCVLEMGGYHDESEFNGLELWAYQHIFLNGGTVRHRRRAGLDPGRLGARRRHRPQLDELPADDRRRPLRVGGGRPRGNRRPRLRRRHGRGLGAARRHRRVQRPERPPPAAREGLRGARPRLSRRHPQHRPLDLRPGHRRLHGLRRPVRIEALDREDLPRRRGGERDGLPRPLPSRAGAGRERPSGRRRGDLPRSGRPDRERDREGADRRRRLRIGRVAGAAAAQRHRRAGGRRSPPPASDQRRLRLPRGGPGPLVGTRRRPASRTSSPTSRTATAS